MRSSQAVLLAIACFWRIALVQGQATTTNNPATKSTSSLTDDWKTAFPNSNGGWALYTDQPGDCPSQATDCNHGWCCPNSLKCVSTYTSPEGTPGGPYACCPDVGSGSNANCTQQLLQKPTCADPLWGLYKSSQFPINYGLFCCYPFQSGVVEGFCETNGQQAGFASYVSSISQISYTGIRPTPSSSSTRGSTFISSSRSSVYPLYPSTTRNLGSLSSYLFGPSFTFPTIGSVPTSGTSYTDPVNQQIQTIRIVRIVVAVCCSILALCLIIWGRSRQKKKREQAAAAAAAAAGGENGNGAPPMSETGQGGLARADESGFVPPPPYKANNSEPTTETGAGGEVGNREAAGNEAGTATATATERETPPATTAPPTTTARTPIISSTPMTGRFA